MIGVMSMKEDDVIRIAMNFVAEKGLDAKQVERVKFVDVREVPERFRRDGNFWASGSWRLITAIRSSSLASS